MVYYSIAANYFTSTDVQEPSIVAANLWEVMWTTMMKKYPPPHKSGKNNAQDIS